MRWPVSGDEQFTEWAAKVLDNLVVFGQILLTMVIVLGVWSCSVNG